jgi:NADPH:quinone reductase-like Zn-dependent oxidoreductase
MGSPADFQAMLDFVDAHAILPLIDRVFDFAEAPEALLHLDSGTGFGKVVVAIGSV